MSFECYMIVMSINLQWWNFETKMGFPRQDQPDQDQDHIYRSWDQDHSLDTTFLVTLQQLW